MSRNRVSWAVVPVRPGLLYEGPRWVAEAGVFQWVDILSASIHRWDPYGSADAETRETGLEYATVALPLDADRMLVASRSSLHVYSWRDDAHEVVGRWAFPDRVRFNDGAIAPNGDIYVGSMSMARVRGAAALYKFDLDSRTLTTVLDQIGISNGLCWTDDNTAYYVDSLVPQIDRLVVNDGVVSRERWIQLGPDDEPDGIAVAGDGTLAVAMWEGSRIELANAAGQPLPAVSVPALFPTAVAFGGDQGELVLVTTAADQDDAREPAPGKVFVGRVEDLLGAGGSS